MNSAEEFEMEALKTLHDGHLQKLHALSDRPFHVMLQAVTLNVAVVAGLIAGAVNLVLQGKVLGTVLLAAFNILVLAYIQRQGSLYEEEKEQYRNIEASLLGKCPSLTSLPSISKNKNSCSECLTGTKSFYMAVMIAAICSILALWCPLAFS